MAVNNQTPITFDESTNRVMRQLDDETGDVWSRGQIKTFIQDGYDNLCRDSECLFDMVMFDRQPFTGNYTRPFEREYMTDWPILRQFNFTKESDLDYMQQGSPYPIPGPANHTSPDEANFFTTTDEPATQATIWYLPEGFSSVSRVTHDWLRLQPENSRYLRKSRNIYPTETGGVFSYSQDQDGLFALRVVGVPTLTIEPETITGLYGGIRQITSYGYDQETVIGTYGGIRSLPQHFMASSQEYGGLKRITPDQNATRVEFFRLGASLTEHAFEIPNRAVRYCEWWALHRAYSNPGEGEDRVLSEHYRVRYEMGRDRIKERMADMLKERAFGMGQRRQGKLDAYLERFPSDYGYKRPFRG